MLLLVGDDWAEDHHDVEIPDESGRRLGKARRIFGHSTERGAGGRYDVPSPAPVRRMASR